MIMFDLPVAVKAFHFSSQEQGPGSTTYPPPLEAVILE
jgi:hypothetical protein